MNMHVTRPGVLFTGMEADDRELTEEEEVALKNFNQKKNRMNGRNSLQKARLAEACARKVKVLEAESAQTATHTVQPNENLQLDLRTAPNNTIVTESMLVRWIGDMGGAVSAKSAPHARAIHADGGDNLLALRELQVSHLRKLGMGGIEARSVHACIQNQVLPLVDERSTISSHENHLIFSWLMSWLP